MPPVWRSPDDPENLRVVARLMALHRALTGVLARRVGVHRYRGVEELEADRYDRRPR